MDVFQNPSGNDHKVTGYNHLGHIKIDWPDLSFKWFLLVSFRVWATPDRCHYSNYNDGQKEDEPREKHS